jgi:hypothetical protein
MGEAADVVVTMGCGDSCPVFPGKQHLDWELPGSAGKSLEGFASFGTRSIAA